MISQELLIGSLNTDVLTIALTLARHAGNTTIINGGDLAAYRRVWERSDLSTADKSSEKELSRVEVRDDYGCKRAFVIVMGQTASYLSTLDRGVNFTGEGRGDISSPLSLLDGWIHLDEMERESRERAKGGISLLAMCAWQAEHAS